MRTSARTRSSFRLLAPFVSIILVLAVIAPINAAEVQLAGIRLGDHAIRLLDVYGNPHGVIRETSGGGAAATGAAAMPGAAVGMGPALMGPPGASMAGVPGMPGGMMGAPGAMPPGMGVAGAGPMPGDMPGLPGGGGMPGMAGPPGMGPPMGMPGMEGAAAPGGGAVAAGGGGVPQWALPVWVALRPDEVEWVYQRDGVILGFVLDDDGLVTVIAVAGDRCDYARTSLWRPHAYVKLGDSFKHVIYRYGYPDETQIFTTNESGIGFPVTVTFAEATNSLSRDVILRYVERNNIAFTCHDMEVVRIHIWSRD